MSKDVEIRRLAILKSTLASLSPMSLLNLSLEILKTETKPITTETLFQTAFDIAGKLPQLKEAVNTINVAAAKEAERWVAGESETIVRGMKETAEVVFEGEKTKAEDKAEEKTEGKKAEGKKTEGKKTEGKAEEGKASEVVDDDDDVFVPETPAEKKEDDVVIGEIKAVSKTGKGVKIGEDWYSITERTEKKCTPEKGLKVKIKFVKGSYGFLAQTLEKAA